jgi:cytochrome P450
VTKDDVYEGYLIPKGTMLFANAYAIHHDPDEYEDPSEFIPERFLNNKFGVKSEKALEENDGRRATYGFGAGRRVCPGQRLSENSLVSGLCLAFYECPLVLGRDLTKFI